MLKVSPGDTNDWCDHSAVVKEAGLESRFFPTQIHGFPILYLQN
jgi:hypothetical protein